MTEEFADDLFRVNRDLQEHLIAQRAVSKFRVDRLYELIDALAGRIKDCDELIAKGEGHTYERAYNEMIKPQVRRIVEAKNHLVESSASSRPAKG